MVPLGRRHGMVTCPFANTANHWSTIFKKKMVAEYPAESETLRVQFPGPPAVLSGSIHNPICHYCVLQQHRGLEGGTTECGRGPGNQNPRKDKIVQGL